VYFLQQQIERHACGDSRTGTEFRNDRGFSALQAEAEDKRNSGLKLAERGRSHVSERCTGGLAVQHKYVSYIKSQAATRRKVLRLLRQQEFREVSLIAWTS
jgi:hypothetical protein